MAAASRASSAPRSRRSPTGRSSSRRDVKSSDKSTVDSARRSLVLGALYLVRPRPVVGSWSVVPDPAIAARRLCTTDQGRTTGHGRTRNQVPCTKTPVPPWFGSWQQDPPDSPWFNPWPYRNVTLRIEPWNDGLRVVYDMVRRRGGVTHMEWSGRFDGREYPVQGVDYVLTNAYRQLSERSYEIEVRVDGREGAVAKAAVSQEGRRWRGHKAWRYGRGQS